MDPESFVSSDCVPVGAVSADLTPEIELPSDIQGAPPPQSMQL